MSLALRTPVGALTLSLTEGQIFANDTKSTTAPANTTIYGKLSCTYLSKTLLERQELRENISWIAPAWLTEAGLVGASIRPTGAVSHRRLNDTTTADTIEFALELGSDASGDTSTCEALCNLDLNNVSLEAFNPHKTQTMSSGRVRRIKRMLGRVQYLTGQLRLSVAEFVAFQAWYNAYLRAEGKRFSHDLLATNPFDATEAMFATPWSGTYTRGNWSVSVNLTLF